MKTIIYIFLLMVLSFSAQSKIHTVSNQITEPAMYNTIQAAIDSAKQGDTIYVQGSSVAYANFTVHNKRLHIFGPGFAPETVNQATAFVSVGTIRNSTDARLSNGGSIQGMAMGSLNITSNGPSDRSISDYTISRCSFTGGRILFHTSTSNVVIESCYFSASTCGLGFNFNVLYTNFIIQNNVFRIDGFNNGVINGLINSSNILIDHNLFYTNAVPANGSPVFTADFNQVSKNLMISNNFFINMNVGSLLSNSSFYRNVTFFPTIPTPSERPWEINGNVDIESANHHGVNPMIVSQSSVNSGAPGILLDFSLLPSSPYFSAGMFHKPVGLLFNEVGSLNWKRARTVRLPIITQFTIRNTTVGPNGQIIVDIKARNNN